MKQGDIVTICFPYTNHKDAKRRPALVISNEKYNFGKEILLVGISTKNNIPRLSRVLTNEDLKHGSLLRQSYVKFTNIMSFEKHLIIKKIGSIKAGKLRQILGQFKSFLTTPSPRTSG